MRITPQRQAGKQPSSSSNQQGIAGSKQQFSPRSDVMGAQAIDLKIKSALRSARSLIFRSPMWPIEFEGLKSD